jgi:hypothetical protein
MSREETLTLPKLARSFVAGDDGRTKRRKGKENTQQVLFQRAVDVDGLKDGIRGTRLGTGELSIVLKVVVA